MPCFRGSSRVVMELRRFLGFSQVVPLVPWMQQITAWASSDCHWHTFCRSPQFPPMLTVLSLC